MKGKTPQSATLNRGEQNSENGKTVLKKKSLNTFPPVIFLAGAHVPADEMGGSACSVLHACSRVCPCNNCPLFLSALAAAHLKFGFKAKELREQAVVLKVVCPPAALGGLLALEGLAQCKTGEKFSRGLAGSGGEMGNPNSEHLRSCPSLDNRKFGELQCFAVCWSSSYPNMT